MDQPGVAVAAGVGIVFLIVYIVLIVAVIAGLWASFSKAGQPGWAAIIPIYNIIVWLQVADKPIWWIILMCIPLVNFIMAILVSLAFAQKFGKSGGFGIGLLLLPFIFYPMLGFGSAEYEG